METDICCAHDEVAYVDEVRGLSPGIVVDYVTNNIDTQKYEEHWQSPMVEQGISYPSSREMYSNMTRLYEQHNVAMTSLFTVWNCADCPAVDTWMDDTYWGDSVARSHGVAHDWPGSYVTWPHSGPNSEPWVKRWAFYKHVHDQMRTVYKKPVLHMFTIGGDTAFAEWNQTQQMVREIEDADVIPDVWIVNNFQGPKQQEGYQLVPESRPDGQPAQTLTGFAYWLLKHIHGERGRTVLDLAVAQHAVASRGGAEWVNVTLRNRHAWLDFIPVVRTSADGPVVVDGPSARVEVRGEGVAATLAGGRHRIRRLWPGEAATLAVRCQHHGSRLTITAFCHPSSDMVSGAQSVGHVGC